MGLGEPIGYSARVSQNNNGLYQNQVNYFLRGIHIALMGDPTLRLHPVVPASGVIGVTTQPTPSWSAPGARSKWSLSAPIRPAR